MPYPASKWDLVPVYGVFMTAPGDTPVQGTVDFKLSQRVTRTDGRTIYPDGARVRVTIGKTDDQDATVRASVRSAWRAADADAQGEDFDGGEWDIWWDTKVLPAAIFTGFPASDDPDILQRDWTVTVSESLTGANGRSYAIQPLLTQLEQPIPGINLGVVEVPPGSPATPEPVYAKGIAGGVAALDADGDVVDADGVKVVAGGGTPGADGASAYEVAVLDGFIGDETAWLASLKGEPGVDGADGVNGADGADGVDGADGATGAKGDKGDKGDTGDPGTTTWSGITDRPELGTASASDVEDFATAAQGALADTAVQPAGLSSYATTSSVTTGLAGKANTSHTHSIANVTNLQTTLDGKAAASHTHTVANVTGLQTALDGKATTAQGAKADTAIQSPTQTVTGIEFFPSKDDFPSTGVEGVLYFCDQE